MYLLVDLNGKVKYAEWIPEEILQSIDREYYTIIDMDGLTYYGDNGKWYDIENITF